ncbi:MAG: hypothetical protein HRU18_01135 [Pseudoalteromonas sp.]|uniref:hypothetical protein n=1 Tax=Pseudoalteromonas sp. TaxID=53249 RepID=UPI001E104C8E|nr:hypothetical protein [Pseudoalteromonas sp.]NRA76783.1 hypothetical protein [Pseudoalteromonas sp.]
MLKQLKAISELEHEKELVVYKIKNGYRICEDHGELVATAKPKKFVDIMAPIDELGIRNLKETLRRKNSILKKPSEVEVNKTCSCGRFFKTIPDDCIIHSTGYWWNCECKSTLFYGFISREKENKNDFKTSNNQFKNT